MAKGRWLDTKSDSIITFPDFIPNGQPYEYTKPKPIEAKEPIKTEPKKGFWQRLFAPKEVDLKGSIAYENWKKRKLAEKENPTINSEDSEDKETSQGDGLMTLDDDDILFPEEF